MNKILEGRITHVNSNGFGFIQTDRKIDFFFHHTQFRGNWKILLRRFVNDEIVIVQFISDPEATEGPRAIDVVFKDSLR